MERVEIVTLTVGARAKEGKGGRGGEKKFSLPAPSPLPLTRPISSSLREVSTWHFCEQIARSKKTPALQANVQLVFSWAPKLARKCESRHWFPCGADRRSVYGHVIIKYSRMSKLPHFLSYGAPSTRALRYHTSLLSSDVRF